MSVSLSSGSGAAAKSPASSAGPGAAAGLSALSAGLAAPSHSSAVSAGSGAPAGSWALPEGSAAAAWASAPSAGSGVTARWFCSPPCCEFKVFFIILNREEAQDHYEDSSLYHSFIPPPFELLNLQFRQQHLPIKTWTRIENMFSCISLSGTDSV